MLASGLVGVPQILFSCEPTKRVTAVIVNIQGAMEGGIQLQDLESHFETASGKEKIEDPSVFGVVMMQPRDVLFVPAGFFCMPMFHIMPADKISHGTSTGELGSVLNVGRRVFQVRTNPLSHGTECD